MILRSPLLGPFRRPRLPQSGPDPPEPEVYEEEWSTTVLDLVTVRDILLSYLPPELVYIILELAEYFACVKTVRKKSVSVSASRAPGNNASLFYLVTAPILEDSVNGCPLKLSIRFTIISHDQGWCNDAGIKDTYIGHTWFEAAILRSDDDTTPQWIDAVMKMPVNLIEAQGLGYDSSIEVKASEDEDSSRWPIQYNVCASPTARTHAITWDSSEPSSLALLSEASTSQPKTETKTDNDDRLGDEGHANTGAGDGKGFVDSLKAGDRIAVIARARHPAWVNNVGRVEISVFYRLVPLL